MLGNLKDIMGKLQEAQSQAQEMKDRLELIEIKEHYQGIEVMVNGNRSIRDLKIDPLLLSNVEELEDKIVLAINRAMSKAEGLHDQEMKKMAKCMMPGMDLFK